MSSTRRDFLKAFGLTAAALAAGPAVAAPLVKALEAAAPVAAKASSSPLIFMIRALPSNVANIFFAPTAAMAIDKSKAMMLRPGESVEFDVDAPPTVFFDRENWNDKIQIETFGSGGGDGSGGGGYTQAHVE